MPSPVKDSFITIQISKITYCNFNYSSALQTFPLFCMTQAQGNQATTLIQSSGTLHQRRSAVISLSVIFIAGEVSFEQKCYLCSWIEAYSPESNSGRSRSRSERPHTRTLLQIKTFSEPVMGRSSVYTWRAVSIPETTSLRHSFATTWLYSTFKNVSKGVEVFSTTLRSF